MKQVMRENLFGFTVALAVFFSLCFAGESTAKSFEDITLADIKSVSLSSERINGSNNGDNQIWAGRILLYKTNLGRYGKMEILSYGYNLTVRWITYDSDGSVYRSADDFLIQGTCTYDMDYGTQVSPGTDIWWEVVEGPIRYIVPKNGAKFALYKEPNDDFLNASALTGESGRINGSNRNATIEAGEPIPHGGYVDGGKSVWWVWTAPKTDYFFFDTHGSSFSPLVEIYTGSDLNALTGVVGTFYRYYYGEDHLIFHAVSGVRYYIAVDGYEGMCGDILLEWGIEPAPENDILEKAVVLNDFSGRVTGSNESALKEAGEPDHAGNSGGKSVWWTWTAPETGDISINTKGSNFDTLLAVYTGSGITDLTEISSNNNAETDDISSLMFQAEAGVQYYIAVDGYEGESGDITLNWMFTSPYGNFYKFERMWPILQQPWYFWSHDLAVDKDDFVYIADLVNCRILKFTSEGQFVAKWGNEGFPSPTRISFDKEGFIYILESHDSPFGGGPCYIHKFTSNGEFVKKWTSEPRNVDPNDMAIDSNGFIYLTDVLYNGVLKFTPDGQLSDEWGIGRIGSGDGEFNIPGGITTDSDDFVYVADTRNHRIQKFTSDGTLVIKWGNEGSGNGEFKWPMGIEIFDGFIYVADVGNDRIQKFTTDGEYLTEWKYECRNISFDSKGFIYGAMSYEIQKFSPDGQLMGRWSSKVIEKEVLDSVSAIDSKGYLYEVGANQINKFSPDGQLITTWGNQGAGNGEFESLAITVDAQNFVYSIDSYKHTIQKFTSDGDFIARWEFGEYEGGCPIDIAVDRDGFIYVLDNMDSCIRKFNSRGEYVKTWGSRGSEVGELSAPDSITLDNESFVYVADTSNNRIQKFTSEGQYVSQWGSNGSGDGHFNGPRGIMTDSNNFIYVADSYNNRIQKFSPDGQFITSFGESGSNPGQLNYPTDLAVSSDGKVYVSDSTNNRVQVFKPTLSKDKTKAIVVAGGGPYDGNSLWTATQMSANFAYRALTYQGFTKNTIFYLSSDTELDLDGNGQADDVDRDAINANLEYAITEWAKDADSLVMYLTDHGGTNSFRMNGTETLTAGELDSWLDALQQTIPGKIIVVYDACKSGSFVAALTPPAGKKRIVIASTSPPEDAYFVSQGSVSFSNYFWTHVFNGFDVRDAFEFSRQAMVSPVEFQNPLMDADGNGFGNDAEDYRLTQGVYIGNGTDMPGKGPVIGSVSYVAAEEANTFRFTVSGVTDEDGISRVWAVIRPPDYNQGAFGSAVQSLPGFDLMPKLGQDGIYEGTYDGFTTSGTYRIALYAKDGIGNTSVYGELVTVTVENPLRRKAIIIAGGPETDPLWPAIEKNAGLAYEALRFQGYGDNDENDDIYLMSPAGISGVAGMSVTPGLSNLRTAIEIWAGQSTYDLVLYMIGNSQDGGFQLSETETLSAAALDQMLDTMQNSTSARVSVIYDACGSGTFVSSLTVPEGKERVLISSATGDQCPSFASDGSLSFSQYFWNSIADGMNVRDAFVAAYQAVKYLGQTAGVPQVPTLDDNGNGTGNEKSDGSIAKAYSIGAGIMLAGDNPIIGAVSSSAQTLNGETSATIQAENVTSTGAVHNVSAVIIPPDAASSDPLTNLPEIELADTGNGLYQGDYTEFSSAGVYQIIVYVSDTDGNISLPAVTQIEQTVGSVPPSEPDLLQISLSPGSSANLRIYDLI